MKLDIILKKIPGAIPMALAAVLSLTLALPSTLLQAAAPLRTLGFQGQLINGGAPLNSTVNATFTFYDSLSGASPTGSPIFKTVTVNSGYFSAQFSESDLSGVNFDGALYLEVNINGTTLSPRSAVNPAASSLKAFGAFSYASAPAAGPAGSLYFNTTDGKLYVSSGSAWGAASPWASNGGSTFFLGGNVGIGTSTPSDALSVKGDSLGLYDTDGMPRVKLSAKPGEAAVLTLTNADGASVALQSGDEYLESLQGFYIRNNAAGNAALSVNGSLSQTAPLIEAVQGASTLFVVKPDGIVGIGTTSPASKLDVWGNLRVGTSSTPTFFVDTSLSGGGRVGIGTTTPGRNLTVAGSMSIFRSGATPHLEIIQGSAGTDLKNWRLSGEVDGSFTLYPMTDANGNLRPLRYTHDGRLIVTSAAGTGADARLYVDSGNAASTTAVFLGGNVGIGTLSPGLALEISANAPSAGVFRARNTSTNGFAGFELYNNSNSQIGSFGIGNTGAALFANQMYLGTNGTSSDLQLMGGGTTRLTVKGTGNVGIGTTNPTASLHASGTIRFSSLGAGTLTTDASGNVTVSSDERLKNVTGTFAAGLESIKGIVPITYQWKPETGYDASSTYAGFSAQNVRSAIPEAVSTDARGYLTLADRPILAALVNAIKELAAKIDGFAKSFRTDELCVNKTNGTSACFNGDQLEAAVAAAQSSNTPAASPAPAPAPAIVPPAVPAMEAADSPEASTAPVGAEAEMDAGTPPPIESSPGGGDSASAEY